MDYTVKIGGEAGQGIQTIGETLARVFSRSGYHVFSHQDYESRVRGGHNFYQVRFSERPVMASKAAVDILVAMDKASIELHERELAEDGIAVYDSLSLKTKYEGRHFLDIPMVGLAQEQGGNKMMSNTVAIGAILGMLGMDLDILLDVLEQSLERKGSEVVEGNRNSALAGHKYAKQHCTECSFSVSPPGQAKLLIQGNDGIGFGAVASGCKFYTAYPMTPSTSIMDYMASKSMQYGIVVEQAEDEIAAINMALGASFAGVRAMTATSGGGFALMVEGLSLAAMTETPIVIALGQRPGPATGLPTRTEQGDLLYALHTAHGEFPRAVFAPGTPGQAILLTAKAFDIADKYQIPSIILSDQYLADSMWTFDPFDPDGIDYRDYRLREDDLKGLAAYKRHALTEDGVSPLAVPGASTHLVVTDSDEHDEYGHIIEDARTRTQMVRKRLIEKMPRVRGEMGSPLLYGNNDPRIVIAGWGSTYGVMKEAVDSLSREASIAMLHFSELYPFPDTERVDFMRVLRDAPLTICIENNASSQFARLVKAETGYEFAAHLSKYDGRPFLLDDVLGGLHDHI